MAGARPLSRDEQERWLAAARCQRDRTYFILGLATGLRVSEMLALRIRHVWTGHGPSDAIALERRYLKHGRGAYRKSVTGRSIVLHPLARAAIQSLVAEISRNGDPLNPHAFLFASNRGRNRPLTRRQIHNVIRDTAYRAGISLHRVSTHSPRKTLATSVYEASGHDLLLTKEIMQHRSIETTWRYLEVSSDKARDVVLRLDLPGTLSPPPPKELAETTEAAASAGC